MVHPTQSDIGRKIVYRGWGGEVEEGVLSSFNDKYLFVRFGASVTAQACDNDERISWLSE